MLKSFYLCSVAIMVLGSGCSSSSNTTQFAGDRVVGRMDDLAKKPEWASESSTVKEKGENLWIVGIAEVPPDSRVQAAFKMSDASARGFLANKIETQVTKLVESSESGLSMADQSLKSLIQEVSQAAFKNIDVKERYWEKVARTSSTGEENLVLKVFSLIEISKSDFKKMLMDSSKKAPGANKGVRNKVENIIRKQWNDESIVDAEQGT